MTGLGYDQAKTGDLTSLDALYDPKYKGKVDYLTEMRDTIGLTMLKLGLDPSKATKDDCDAAIAEIKKAVDAGIVRAFKGNEYAQDLISGNIVLSMAWSGDMVQALKDKKTLRFTIADQGGMLWTDNVMIPNGAKNAYTAQVMIDFCYDPTIAAQIEAYVNYICPVKGAAEVLLADGPGGRQQPADLPAGRTSWPSCTSSTAWTRRPRNTSTTSSGRSARPDPSPLRPSSWEGSWAASCGDTSGSSRSCCWRPASCGSSSSMPCPGSRCS